MSALVTGARIRVTNPTITAAALLGRTGTVVLRSIGAVVCHMDATVPEGLRCDAADAHTVVLWPDEITPEAPRASVAARLRGAGGSREAA